TDKAAIETACRGWRMALWVSTVAMNQIDHTAQIMASRSCRIGARHGGCVLHASCAARSIARGNGGSVRRAGVGAGAHGRQGKAREARVPEALEADVVAVLSMHAGDAMILVVPGAMVGRDPLGHQLGLARPGN